MRKDKTGKSKSPVWKILKETARAPVRERRVLWETLISDIWGGSVHLRADDLIRDIAIDELPAPGTIEVQKFPIRVQARTNMRAHLEKFCESSPDIRMTKDRGNFIAIICYDFLAEPEALFLTANPHEFYGYVSLNSLHHFGQLLGGARVELPMRSAQKYLTIPEVTESDLSDSDIQELIEEVNTVSIRLEKKWTELSEKQNRVLARLENAS